MIEEEVYIEHIESFETSDRELHVCRLKRALYALKQTPRAWYTMIDSYFIGLGFTKSEADVTMYHIVVEDKLLIIVLYVDDLTLTEVCQGDGELFVSQGKYANAILGGFRMESGKPIETPLASDWRKEDATSREVVEAIVYRQLVGSLMYLVNTQPDMCYG
eukprot:PITA_17241